MDNDLYISESEYERKSRRTAWIVSIVFHLCALLPLAFITCSAPGSTEDLTQIVGWGGGGGNPDVDAPIGEAPKGDPDAKGGGAPSRQEPQKTTATTPQQTPSDPKSPAADPTNPSRPASSTSSTQTSTQATDQGSNSSSTSTQQGSGEAKGQPDGRGTKPAGGSGGSSVGVGDGNLGRCWSISPSRAAGGATTTEEGRVTVTAVVKWDGKVTAIRKVSGSTSLFSKARSLLSRAKACRADPGTPDVTITLTYNFNLN